MTVDQGGYPPETGSARTLGDTFRATRTSAGVSVEQVESDLRIKAKYIEAIEDGDTVALPSRAYTDGFLRNYATYLGMDPADAVRRFAAEQGLSAPTARIAPVSPLPKANKTNPLSGYASPEPRRGVFAMFGRGVVASMPFFLFAGVGFGGYTGFVAARDAGLIPAQFGSQLSALVSEDKASAKNGDSVSPSQTADKGTEAKNPDDSKSAKALETKLTDKAQVKTAEAKPDRVGEETSTGRPDSLTYARTGSTPYWQAKPPAVEPADGPVSEIEPQNAGLLRANTAEDEPKPSRWSSSGATDTAPADVDASRIAAAAREALAGSASATETVTQPTENVATEPTENGTSENVPAETAAVVDDRDTVAEPAPAQEVVAEPAPAPAPAPAQEIQVASLDTTPATPEFGIGPVVVEGQPSDLSPVQPQEAPRRFALIAGADTWVQITDSAGNVTYTGILSPGEAYTIPSQQGLRLKTGNAGGLFIEVDGQRFGPLGSNGAVMRNVVLNPGAVRASFTLSQAATLVQ